MKKLFLGTLLAVGLASCEEEPLPIIMEREDAPLKDTSWVLSTPSAPENKVVLLEDFTGVRCPNCPTGHQAVKDILTNNPGRVVAVAIHPGREIIQAFPFPDEPDFNTIFGKQIKDLVGNITGLPVATADRVERQGSPGSWVNIVNTRKALNTPVNLELSVLSYDDATHELIYQVKVECTEAMGGDLLFSTMITEDGIISKQEYAGGVYDPYTHNHILRTMPQFGSQLNPAGTPSLDAGRVFVKEFKVILNADWKAENCNLVAFAHRQLEVLQAKEVKIK